MLTVLPSGINKWVQKGDADRRDAVLEALKVLLSESLLDLIHRRGGKQNPSNVSKKMTFCRRCRKIVNKKTKIES